MKLWHSFAKELLLASRSFYFYVELVMAVIFLILLLLVIPETLVSKSSEYLYYGVPESALAAFEQEMLQADEDHRAETVDFRWDKANVQAALYETADAKLYVFDDQDAAVGLADKNLKFAAVIQMDDAGALSYTYYMQGYETRRMLNTYAVAHNENAEVLKAAIDAQDLRVLHEDQVLLNDRENMLPTILTFNGSLMGMFILAAYIFLDKKEGVIKAYAVTTSPVWHYLLSKVAVVILTSLVASLIITLPVMGFRQPNYPILIIFLLTSGFAASALGLLLSSFYRDIVQSFGALSVVMILMMLPTIAYFIPTWSPAWIEIIPTHMMLQSFKESLLPRGDASYVLTASLACLMAGILLFLFAVARFKKTLTL